MKTVLITGCSSGFGEAVAVHFAEAGWNVVATLRNPAAASPRLTAATNVLVTRLDVQDRASIQQAVDSAITRFGGIDAVVNNAGYGVFGVFEGLPREAIQAQFDVNLFGVMDVTRTVLPHLRAKRAGTIVNISSGAGAVGFPMASLYSASKFALEGFSEALSYELRALGIRVRIVEPGGAPDTGFVARAAQVPAGTRQIDDYAPWLQRMDELYGGLAQGSDVDAVQKVVAAIFEAVTDNSERLRYAPTQDVKPLLEARRCAGEEGYRALTLGMFGK